ncbi:MAG: serine-threonine kinase [Gammaproteobacteria bacterium]|jgi:hypothetical protein|nr:serine-threonine kinase [Gammaproteobacteria bacterium]
MTFAAALMPNFISQIESQRETENQIMTYDMMNICRKNGLHLKHLNIRLVVRYTDRQRIAEAAVQQNEWTFKDLPDDLRTLYLAKEAIKRNPNIYYEVIENSSLDTAEIKKLAETRKKEIQDNSIIQQNLPVENAGEGIRDMLSIVKENGLYLRYLHKDKITREIVLAAVMENGLALQYAPEEFKKDKDIFEVAFQNNEKAYCYGDKKVRFELVKSWELKQSSINKNKPKNSVSFFQYSLGNALEKIGRKIFEYGRKIKEQDTSISHEELIQKVDEHIMRLYEIKRQVSIDKSKIKEKTSDSDDFGSEGNKIQLPKPR